MVDFLVQLAIQVVLAFASILLSRRSVEQGKLDSIDTDAASYGASIVIPYGTTEVVGQTIWIANNQLIEDVKREGILFGLAGSITTFSYYATFAVVLGEGPVSVRKIWFNDELVGDWSGEPLQPAQGAGFTIILGGKKDWLDMQFFEGSDDQPGSTYIDEIDGADATPAYRGVAYIVFRRVPVLNYGNAIPTVKAEIVAGNPQGVAQTMVVPLGNSIASAFTAAPDGRHYMGAFDGTAGPSIVHYDPFSQQVVAQVFQNEMVDLDGVSMGFWADNGTPLLYDDTLNQLYRFGGPLAARVYVFDADSLRLEGHLKAGSLPGVVSGSLHNGVIAYVDGNGTISTIAAGLVGAQTGTEITTGYSWRTIFAATGINFGAKIVALDSVTVALAFVSDGNFTNINLGSIVNGVGIWGPVDTGVASVPYSLGYSENLNLLFLAVSGGDLLSYNAGTGVFDRALGVTLKPSVQNGYENSAMTQLTQDDPASIWLVTDDDEFIEVDLASMTVLRTVDPSTFGGTFTGISTDGGLIYSPIYDGLTLNGYTAFFLNRAFQAKTTVGEVAADIFQRANLPASYYDVTLATTPLGGYPLSGNARDALRDIALVKAQDVFEVDGKIVVRPQGSAPVVTIDPDEIGAGLGSEGNRDLDFSTSPEAGAPMAVELNFADMDADHESNVATARTPRDSVGNRQTIKVDTALSMTAPEAALDVANIFNAAWRERHAVSFDVALAGHLHIAPADRLVINDGGDNLVFRVRDLKASQILTIDAVADLGEVYAPVVEGATHPAAGQTLPTVSVSPSTVSLIDASLPADGAGNAAGYYLTAGPLRPAFAWPGALLFESDNAGVTYNLVGSVTAQIAAAFTTAALGDVPQPAAVDRGNSLVVRTSLALTSTTLDALYLSDLVNLAYVASGNDWELVQYASASDNGDGTWTLTNLLRGRRGTEHLTGGHAIGDKVIFYNADALYRAGSVDDVGDEYVAAATAGEPESSARFLTAPFAARGLRPYGPAHVTITRDGSDDVTVTATRRTRIGGASLNGQDVPLSETSENYSLDILDGPGGAVVRTKSASALSFAYPAAEQTTDFGSLPSSLDVVVYQISAETGRGAPAAASVAF